jgi:hypothetical protein
LSLPPPPPPSLSLPLLELVLIGLGEKTVMVVIPDGADDIEDVVGTDSVLVSIVVARVSVV